MRHRKVEIGRSISEASPSRDRTVGFSGSFRCMSGAFQGHSGSCQGHFKVMQVRFRFMSGAFQGRSGSCQGHVRGISGSVQVHVRVSNRDLSSGREPQASGPFLGTGDLQCSNRASRSLPVQVSRFFACGCSEKQNFGPLTFPLLRAHIGPFGR